MTPGYFVSEPYPEQINYHNMLSVLVKPANIFEELPFEIKKKSNILI